ncbi:MAG: hypothetical protein HON70_41990 [Lentisphaerae bacterium]|nr:hypothetical protein [Lentisphaerota bacterium]
MRSSWLVLAAALVPVLAGGAGDDELEYLYLDEEAPYEENLSVDYCTEMGDPIAGNSGAFYFNIPLFGLGGPMKLAFVLYYRSDMSTPSPRVPNDFPSLERPNLTRFSWTPRCQAVYTGPDSEFLTVWLGDGNTVCFRRGESGNSWGLFTGDPPSAGKAQREKFQLKVIGTRIFMLSPLARRIYVFQNQAPGLGRALFILDRNGNAIRFTYADPEHNNPSSISDGLGRTLYFTYVQGDEDAEAVLTLVTDGEDRSVHFSYENAFDNGGFPSLREVRNANSETTRLSYQPAEYKGTTPSTFYLDNVSTVTKPRGNVPYTQHYGVRAIRGSRAVRVVSQFHADGHRRYLMYDEESFGVLDQKTVDTVIRHGHHGHHSSPQAWTDPDGKTVNFERDGSDRTTAMVDRKGARTEMSYFTLTGELSSLTNAKGGVTSHSRTSQSQTVKAPDDSSVNFVFYNLTRTTYPDGTTELREYDERGNVAAVTDRTGVRMDFTYDERGQLLAATNAAGGVTVHTYNDDGTMATSTNSDTGTTTYGYDRYKRRTTMTHPDQTTTLTSYDANDRVLSATDENGKTASIGYNANGNVETQTDRVGNENVRVYNDMDWAIQETDRTGRSLYHEYNPFGKRVETRNDAGHVQTFVHNNRDLLVNTWEGPTMGDWQTTYDAEGIRTSSITPLGHTTHYASDALGKITSVRDPLLNETTYTCDLLGRLVGSHDPVGRAVAYEYAGADLLAVTRVPGIGEARYTYNALGGLETVTDANRRQWQFTYTPMGRPRTEQDPLGNAWTYSYDQRGRRTGTAYPDGTTLTRTLDGVGNVTAKAYSDGTVVEYTYDAESRLTGATGFARTLDAEGRVTNTRINNHDFGATYDEAGRLATVTYPGDFAVTYEYESQRDVLEIVRDNLPRYDQMVFKYDKDRRLIRMTRGNNMGTEFTYDAAGRMTRMQAGYMKSEQFQEEELTIDLTYTYDPSGKVAGITGTLPLAPDADAMRDGLAFSVDAASQLNTGGYVYDAVGRLSASPGQTFTWDGASRLVAVGDAVLAYDGMHGVLSRTENGHTTNYYRNHAIAGSPIVAEQDAGTGEFTRYYAWTPSGRLLWLTDLTDGNKPRYYHFDHIGSTLMLSGRKDVYPIGTVPTVADAYAYSPYGRLLAHEGDSTQPFTFIGQYGIRQEGANGRLYQMRARYYNAETATFLSRDPLGPVLNDLTQINLYQYAGCDPLTFVDPTGMKVVMTRDGGNRIRRFTNVPFPRAMQKFLIAVVLRKLYDVLTEQISELRDEAAKLDEELEERFGESELNAELLDIKLSHLRGILERNLAREGGGSDREEDQRLLDTLKEFRGAEQMNQEFQMSTSTGRRLQRLGGEIKELAAKRDKVMDKLYESGMLGD